MISRCFRQVLIRALDIVTAGPRSKALAVQFSLGKGAVVATGLRVLQDMVRMPRQRRA
eukprot:SAG11_NODE_2165_length_3728_cov_2.060072_6_plen_57_part_01